MWVGLMDQIQSMATNSNLAPNVGAPALQQWPPLVNFIAIIEDKGTCKR